MILLPSGTKVWLATGHTDMRKGIGGLSLLVQKVLGRDPFCGHLFVFRGRRSDLIKIVWHDGQGGCLFMKRLARLIHLGRDVLGSLCSQCYPLASGRAPFPPLATVV